MGMNALRVLTVICCVFCLAPKLLVAQKQLSPLPIKAALARLSFPENMPISLSPDGEWVAYALADPRRKESSGDLKYRFYTRTGVRPDVIGCDVWLTNVKTGRATNLTEGKGTSWGPVWSPDSQRLAFYSDRSGAQHVWVWEKSTGQLREISNGIVRAFFNHEVVRWTPDSKRVLVKVLPEGMTVEEAVNLGMTAPAQQETAPSKNEAAATVRVFRSMTEREIDPEQARQNRLKQQNAFLILHLADLELIDVASGREERVVHRAHPIGVWLSPDGTNLAFMDSKGFESDRNVQYLGDLVVKPLAAGPKRVVASNIREGQAGGVASWSPDGKFLAYTTYGPLAKGDCFILPVAGGEPHNLTKEPHPNFGDDSRAPMWDASGQALYLLNKDTLWRATLKDEKAEEFTTLSGRTVLGIVSRQNAPHFSSPDGRSMVVVTRDADTKRVGFYQVDLASGATVKLFEEDKAYGDVPSFTIDVPTEQKWFVFAAESAGESGDIWIVDNTLRNPRRVTKANPQLDAYMMGEVRVIEWRSLDGLELRGALLLPAGYQVGKRYPLVVYQYPTAYLSNHVNHFGLDSFNSATENMQLLATRGYAVLLPDEPVQRGTQMQDIPKAVMPGVDKVIEMGIADPDRLGVMGHSYGGYGVLALLVHTTRFKAAVSRAGWSNEIGLYSQMRADGGSIYIATGETNKGGSLWEKRDRYIENSPLFYFDRIQTPLLVIHGTADRGISLFLTDEIFVCLRRLGKVVEYAQYEGEDHEEGNWAYANQADYLERIINWFDRYLTQTPR